ncbi:DEAD/DEAH box helicase family protein [Flavimobilis sp. GY10621]|uniref:DEAD/DEAH box helicase family protein n=1 Tax=Flavimobilis rhizosphaerae TaxID=2775421 RepID=A0ABR9DPX6_9MICO|nr:DEAD/DEAH box helicase family protein [Flavimobilis rhizosphaerae]MBD9699183.1 DEAD/DEAH box helicase family protein [Flavimobilis rhizosphaerae]
MNGWESGNSPLTDLVWRQTDRCLDVYAKDASRVEQDANNELRIAEGGYSNRQIHELLQNAVDAARSGGHRIEVRLTDNALYVANDGAPFTDEGVLAVMASDLSPKGDDRIGRFGIGFKSVLAVSREPQIFSRSVSFGFNAMWARDTIIDAGYKSPRYPTMRLAQVLDPNSSAAADPNLAELMPWASTIIKLPLVGQHDLSSLLRKFPRDFVLFSPHITNMAFVDQTAEGRNGTRGTSTSVSQSVATDGLVTLKVGPETSTWALAKAQHRPSVRAIEDAGRIAGRDVVDVQYAVRVPHDPGEGSFWAYFPTDSRTTLSGYINAPWRLSDDRTQLLAGAFNEEILTQVLPQLVGRALPALTTEARPATAIDVLPARGREARGWSDDIANEPIFRHLRTVPSVPDGTGQLRIPSELRWPDEIDVAWYRAWAEIEQAPTTEWVHPETTTSDERRLKLSRLIGPASDITGWLESLVTDRTASASAEAILLAARIVADSDRLDASKGARIKAGVARARLIRLEDGTFKHPERGRVFVRVSGDEEGHDFVDSELAAQPDVRAALSALGVVVFDRSGELHAHLRTATSREAMSNPARRGEVWSKIWHTTREMPLDTAAAIIREDLGGLVEKRCFVRTHKGDWRAIDSVFLAGAIVPPDGRRDGDRLISPSFHEADDALLRELGAVAAPTRRTSTPREPWRAKHEEALQDHFIAKQSGSKPDREKIIVSGAEPPWPLEPLASMSDAARVAATTHILSLGDSPSWTVRHSTNTSYGTLNAIAPEIWFLRRHALLDTPFGPLRPKRTIRATDDEFGVLPTVDVSDRIAKLLEVGDGPDSLDQEAWTSLLTKANQWVADDADDRRRAEFYTWLGGQIDTPEKLVARVGHTRRATTPEYIGVTDDESTYRSMLDAQVPALFVGSGDDVERLVEYFGMRHGKDMLQEEVVPEPVGDPVHLLDLFPTIDLHLRDNEERSLRVQRCTRIVKMVATPDGQKARPLPALREGELLYLTATTPKTQLLQIARVLTLEHLNDREADRLLELIRTQEANEHRQRIRMATGDDERLVAAVGAEALRGSVPHQALEAIEEKEGAASPTRLARLARATHGVEILAKLRPSLESAGLNPPREWVGRNESRRFCVDLGFPTEWAGFPNSPRPAIEVIDGPAELEGLHDYQVHVMKLIKALVSGIDSFDRGLVGLPTGAGKTRVTVQALVEALRDRLVDQSKPIVWIAQSDELCEQAAESWSYVWRAIGPRAPMTLSRLWTTNEVAAAPGTFQLVIATVSKLNSIVSRPDNAYEWLRDPSVVVVDEAHTSIAPIYTNVLEWLGRSSRGKKKRGSLIGLTATPFRGATTDNTEQTERLAKRYDQNRLDRGAFLTNNELLELQDMGVLARVQHKLLDGIDVDFSDVDVKVLDEMKWLPSTVEDQLGASLDRTLRIVDAIEAHPDNWTTIAFTPTVESARTIAALLTDRGIPAASISSNTDANIRRHYISEFKAGRIRVLTNYGVLTQGFDAPKVDAVYVTRPTFSPNTYQQMIGRGLRGKENGGTEEVLIVNVKDNFATYGDRLAFKEFEYLWQR